ncbi:MAG: YdcF family protein [Alphaproteobacteria bacterium]|nr:YdcF family protein [Alphaproteobacteria bacterium]
MYRLLTPSFLIFSLFIIGGMIFKATTPIQCGTILPNDSIFVLTGDARRIPFALRKVQEYPNTDLYIIGAGTHTDINISRPAIIESESKSTYQNALAIKKIATEKQLNRLVIITTEDHIHRAKHLIHSELPNTEIVSCPATLYGMPPQKRLERWATEYIKYIVTMFGIKES